MLLGSTLGNKRQLFGIHPGALLAGVERMGMARGDKLPAVAEELKGGRPLRYGLGAGAPRGGSHRSDEDWR